jgi:hypothetical protein
MTRPTADEHRTGEHGETEPDVVRMRHPRMAMADILAITIGDDAAGQHHFNNARIFKKNRGWS